MTTKKIALDNTETEENVIDVDVWLRRQEELRIKAIAGRNDIQALLNEAFPKEVERQLKKGGTSLTYIPVSEVISRLNKVLGFDGWAYEIIKCERDALDPEFIVAHVRLSVLSKDDFTNIVKDGFGGQKIKRTKAGEIVDLGVDFGIVKKSGSWFSFEDQKLGQGRDSVKQLLLDNTELADIIEAKIREKLASASAN